MRYHGLILLLIAGCSIAPAATVPSSGVSEQAKADFAASLSQIDATGQQHLAATKEQTAVLREIKTELEQIASRSESPKPEPAKEVISESPTEQSQPSATDRASTADDTASRPALWVFYAPFHCPPCERLKADIEAGKFSEFSVQVADDYQPSVYPAIRYKASDGNYRAVLGYSSATLPYLRQQLLGVAAPAMTSASTQASSSIGRLPGPRWNWEGDWSPSYDQAAQHLRDDHGIDPSGMSMDEMQVAHDNAHNGYASQPMRQSRRVVYTSRPTRYYSSGGCPGGMCPR